MSLRLVPAGSKITRVYYAVPSTGSIGQEFPTFLKAARFALERRDETAASVAASYPDGWEYGGSPAEIGRKAADVQCVVDLRWVIEYPRKSEFQGGGGVDTLIERTNVAHLTFEHLDRMEALPSPVPI